MTRQRNDDKSTEFGLWLRHQEEIDSKRGFIATNIDYMWRNYKLKKWLYLEEKRYGYDVKFPQTEMFKIADVAASNDINYCGFHKLIFENTNPEDGCMWLDDKEITREELIKFLRFEI